MRLNDDLTIRTAVHAGRLDWIPSPAPGVDRRMLFRIGEEKARATSIVRYAPGSRFAAHVHGGGEEFLVLEGTFQDENGDYPAGSYIRNPPGSRHAPRADAGCTIFVKLWQFRSSDREQVVRLPTDSLAGPLRLFDGIDEQVRLEQWPADAALHIDNPVGLELLVLAGSFTDGGERFERQSWLRLPAGEALQARSGPDGARLWLKAGTLAHADACSF